jgi:ribosomal-protein-alanine N-acetyltransferase
MTVRSTMNAVALCARGRGDDLWPHVLQIRLHAKPEIAVRHTHYIETKRLLLAPIAPSDHSELAIIAAAREIADTTISVPHPMTHAVARDWVEAQCESTRRGDSAVFTVRRSIEQPPLGLVSLRDIDRDHACAELSFWLAKVAQGHGFAVEAAGALVRYGFKTLKLHRVEAYQMMRNSASAHVLARIGFRFEGTLRERVTKWGLREDVNLWSRLRGDPDSPAARMLGLAVDSAAAERTHERVSPGSAHGNS